MGEDHLGENFLLDDKLFFADETLGQLNAAPKIFYKLMIVDDESEVHNVTRMALDGFSLKGSSLNFISAYSGEEAKQLISENPDTAVILLDVVMEKDDSGLELVRFIREKLNNKLVRIILRTGHPGQAPERNVIKEYDINDYKEKTELTSQKLFTSVVAALRSYLDLKIIERSRKGLEQIINASGNLLKLPSLKQFTHGVLTQLTSILELDESSLYLQQCCFATKHNKDQYCILAGTGEFEKFSGQSVENISIKEVQDGMKKAIQLKESFFVDNSYIGYFKTQNDCENIIYLKSCPPLSPTDMDLIRIFLSNVSISFDNIYYKMNLESKVEERTKELKSEKEKVDNIQKFLSKYVPLQLTEKAMEGKFSDIWGYTRKRLTIFFSDIKGFTQISEAMEPEDVATLLNEYFSEMCGIAHRYNGLVADMVGDGLFIFFGAPEVANDKEHALRCVNMAIDMQKRISELQVKWFNEGIEQPLEIRCGISTGMVNVGGFGSKIRRKYSAMGLHVNLASRLENLCEPGKILISHPTWGLVNDTIPCEPRGKITVKGFSHPVMIHEVKF